MRIAFLVLALIATAALVAIAVGVHLVADRLDHDRVHSVEIHRFSGSGIDYGSVWD